MVDTIYNHAIYGKAQYNRTGPTLPLYWVLQIDWDNDGEYDPDSEGTRISSLNISRGRDYLIRPGGDGFERLSPGSLEVVLENGDGRYSPMNAESPLYPNVMPFRRARLWAKDHDDHVFYLFAGWITDIVPMVEKTNRVKLVISDAIQWMQDTQVSHSILSSVATEDAMAALLDQAGWPWPTAFDESTSSLGYWWGTGDSLLTQLSDLADSELGTIFVAGDGTFTFYSRHHLYAIKATLQDDMVQPKIVSSQPWEVVRNSIKVVAHPITQGPLSVLWSLGDKPSIAAGDELTLWAGYSYNAVSCPATNVISPVATTDYLLNTAEDGTGTNLTADLQITSTIFGDTVLLTAKNNSGSAGYLTLLQIRGTPLVQNAPVTMFFEDTDSQQYYGKKELLLDVPWLQSSGSAYDYAGYLRNQLSRPKNIYTVSLKGLPAVQLGLELFDKVSLDIPGVSSDFRVIHIEHKWVDRLGSLVETTLRLEPFFDTSSGIWTFPVQLGTGSVFGY